MADVIKEWDGFEMTALPLGGAAPVRGLKRGRPVSPGELLARHPHPLRGDVHASSAGIITEINEFEIIVQRDDKVIGEPPQPRELELLGPDELAAAFKEMGLNRPTVNPGDHLIISAFNAEPGINYASALFSEHLETMLAGVEAAARLWPNLKVIWAVSDSQTAPAGAETAVINAAFPYTLPALIKKQITGLGEPLGSGVLDGHDLYFLGRLWRTGLPITRTVISLGGSNYFAPLGSRAADLLTFANLYPHGDEIVVRNGLIRGTSICRLERGLDKSVRALNVIKNRDQAPGWPPAPCLHCGSCTRACPVGLAVEPVSSQDPVEWRIGKGRDFLNGCLLCGACAVACPAGRPLISMIRLMFADAEAWPS